MLPGSCFVNTTQSGGRFTHSDGLLMKVDLMENAVQWVLRVGGSGQDKALAVAAQDGAVYLGGTFEKSFDVDGLIFSTAEDGECSYIEMTMNMDNKVKSSSGLDIFVLKLISTNLDIQVGSPPPPNWLMDSVLFPSSSLLPSYVNGIIFPY